ncbi:MAG: TauD/TfdA family dioxygenase [Inquilinus sp.]|uniref:TauD/TfdA family dioxygenase n=1 Tax=Inquilinus sp. TaxID=1932117 RepID=UPI003F30E531
MSWSSDVAERLPSGTIMPLTVEPRRPTGLLEFAAEHGAAVDAALARHGAVLFRGFGVSGEDTLAALFQRLWTEPLSYVYRSTPRTDVGKGVYTATEYPAAQEIPMHNENAYQRDWPMRIGFHCVTPAASGGQTPLADVGRVTERIDPAILAEFRDRRVRYIRNYSDFIDLPWQTVFQTDSRSEVEAFCTANDIGFDWTEEGLRTSQVCQGTAIHPGLGRELWFNQAQLFHVSSLGPAMAADMLDLFGEAGLPRNARFGDGGAIPDSVVAAVTAAFEREKVVFDWQRDDVLILDNMRVAHGRKPFSGSRRVLVSMGYPHSAFAADPFRIHS